MVLRRAVSCFERRRDAVEDAVTKGDLLRSDGVRSVDRVCDVFEGVETEVERGEAGFLKRPSLDEGRCGVLPGRDLSGETKGLWTELFRRRLFASESGSDIAAVLSCGQGQVAHCVRARGRRRNMNETVTLKRQDAKL